MRIENGKRKKRKDGEKKQKSSVLEQEIFRIMEQCKCQYKNAQKVENKNVHFPRAIPRPVSP